MATTLAILGTRMKTRLDPGSSTPALNNLHSNSITTWANENASQVIQLLGLKSFAKTGKVDYSHFQSLLVIDKSITLTTLSGSLPSDYELAVAVKISSSKTFCRLFLDAEKFATQDSFNFLTTPSDSFPIALAANGKVYIKQSTTSTTPAYLDYIKTHPTMSASQDTVWDSVADKVLLELMMKSFYESIEEKDLMAVALKNAEAIAA